MTDDEAREFARLYVVEHGEALTYDEARSAAIVAMGLGALSGALVASIVWALVWWLA